MQPPVRALFTTAEYEGVWICSAERFRQLPTPSVRVTTSVLAFKTALMCVWAIADRHMTDYEIYCFGGIPQPYAR